MADATITPPDPENGTTRRGFLGHMAGLATAGVILDVGISDANADDRIASALAELEEAVQSKFPNWRVQVRNDVQHVEDFNTGERDADPYCQAILIYTSNEKFGPEEAHWHRDYL